MSISAIPAHVALVDQTGEVPLAELQTLAASLNEQILRDFAPIWSAPASVGAYEAVPPNTWAVVIQKSLDQPGALGYHTDNGNQPISYVEYQPSGPEGYSVTVSHETLEMLADPYGNRQHSALIPEGTSPEQFGLSDPNAMVQYLLEVCDPCEATSYQVGQNYVSDFLLPSWYFTAPQANAFYSHQGGCIQPRQVANGGYVSFGTPSGDWYQVFNENGSLSVQNLGQFDATSYNAIREWTDEKARAYRASRGA
jgi:hypothetical protein